MTVIDLHTLKQVSAPKQCVLCLGNFDGIHIGHKALVDETLKEGTSGHRTDGIRSFGAVEAEPGPLTAGNGKTAHFSGAEQFFAAGCGLFIQLLLFLNFGNEGELGSGSEIIGDRGFGFDQHIISDQLFQFVEVDFFKLCGKSVFFGIGKFIPKGQQMFLTGIDKTFIQFHDNSLSKLLIQAVIIYCQIAPGANARTFFLAEKCNYNSSEKGRVTLFHVFL